MSNLWTNNTATQATGGKVHGTWQASRVEIDSRRVQKGDLFVAIKGERMDGHLFVADALKQGAVAAVVSQPWEGNHLLVPDTLKALEDLGKYARKRSRAKVVGVTGSVGKTSAKEMLRLALSTHGSVFASSGNFNNHIGTPLNLANLPPDIPFAVFEMGMNHAGEIAHLTKMVEPHVAAITNVEAVHMEFFGSIEGIAKAKAEIFEGVAAGGAAVLNRDNAMYPILAEQAKAHGIANIITFGEHVKSHCRLLDYGAGAEGCIVSADVAGHELEYTMKAIGKHWAMTSLLVLATAQALELDVEKTAAALATFDEVEGRGRVIPVGEFLLIDDSYNASPASMRAAFAKTTEVWKALGGKGRKIAALGNMLELGADSAKLHASLAADLQQNGFDLVFTAGDFMKHLHDTLPKTMRSAHVAKAAELLPLLQSALKPDDVLLVKGSHGSKMYELAAMLQGEDKKHAI